MCIEESQRKLLQRIEQINSKVAAQNRDVIAVGPFLALIDPSTEMTWLNYAVPVEPLSGLNLSELLSELREVFQEHDRTLRFEFTESLWSTLPQALEEAGLILEAQHPMLLCTPSDFQPDQAPTVSVKMLTTADDTKTLTSFLEVRNFGFEQEFAEEPPTDKEITQLREQIQTNSMRYALAYLDGIPAGVGITTTSMSGICELVGVTTLQALRRRGVAATLCSFLLKDHFQGGGDLVWLSAGDAIAQATYERIGFQKVATRLNYIDVTFKEAKYC
jgi:ribosomal protein S18 acetylase RimI-like enzyme